ncbi:MAG TPA: recombinase family protein [Terracidiphilus sp.]|nr:recombinase family protein [Terracidiphilus sp.]
MATFERIRDAVSEPYSTEMMRRRTAAGWKMVSIEWQRELPDTEAPGADALPEDIPYGLRISADCMRLEIDPYENEILLRMMDMLAQDFSYASIVSDLNEKGLRTRAGHSWTRVAVFNMMPRLIDVGPRIFSSDEWEKRRRELARRGRPGQDAGSN